jgi:hypothetical protein
VFHGTLDGVEGGTRLLGGFRNHFLIRALFVPITLVLVIGSWGVTIGVLATTSQSVSHMFLLLLFSAIWTLAAAIFFVPGLGPGSPGRIGVETRRWLDRVLTSTDE